MDYEKILIRLSEELKLSGFSHETKKTYTYNITKFLLWTKKESKIITDSTVREYFLYLDKKEYDSSTIRLVKASLKYLFNYVIKINIEIDNISRIKRKKQLPKVLMKEEINQIIENIPNNKHKIIISLIYSSGLRISELINLKKEDINLINNTIHIKQAKGKKDRITILSKKVKKSIQEYICKTNFKTKYLFEGRRGKYTKSSIQRTLKKASKPLNKDVTPHMLRHSFATHLLESGTDIRIIQKLLGHSRPETTAIYAKVATNVIENIKSPFD